MGRAGIHVHTTGAPSPTMSRSCQPFFPGAHTGVPPTYKMLKEEHEVAVLGAPQS